MPLFNVLLRPMGKGESVRLKKVQALDKKEANNWAIKQMEAKKLDPLEYIICIDPMVEATAEVNDDEK